MQFQLESQEANKFIFRWKILDKTNLNPYSRLNVKIGPEYINENESMALPYQRAKINK